MALLQLCILHAALPLQGWGCSHAVLGSQAPYVGPPSLVVLICKALHTSCRLQRCSAYHAQLHGLACALLPLAGLASAA